MKKLLASIIIILFFSTNCFGAITFEKFIKVKPDKNHPSENKVEASFILVNGDDKRVCKRGYLTDSNDGTAETEILSMANDLWDDGYPYEDNHPNVDCPEKTFNDNLPSLSVAQDYVDNNFSSLATIDRNILKQMVNAIYSLKDLQQDGR